MNDNSLKHKYIDKNDDKICISNADKLCSILVTVSFLVTFYSMTIENIDGRYVALFTYSIALFAYIIAVFTTQQRKTLELELLIAAIILFFHFISIAFTGNAEVTHLIWYLECLFISFTLLRIRLWYLSSVIAFTLICAFFVNAIIVDVYNVSVFANVSQNATSIQLIIFASLYYISVVQNNYKIRPYVAFAVLLISLWAGGRGGVISSSFLFLGIMYIFLNELSQNNRGLNKYTKPLFYCTALIIIVAYLFNSSYFISDYLLHFNIKVNSSLIGDVRTTVIIDYCKAAGSNILNFLVGVKLDSVYLIKILGGNPHNMYIFAHANFGIIFFIALLTYSVKAIVFYKNNKLIYSVLLIVLLLRGWSDICGFYGPFDPLIYYFILNAKLHSHYSSGRNLCYR